MIEFSSVSGLARAFGRIPTEVAIAIRPAIAEGAEMIMEESQDNSSWSSRIPGAHFVRTSLSSQGGAIVGVDQVKAPHARPYEGLASGGTAREFRHPVFGHEWWVPQATRPFLAPARQTKGEAVKNLIGATIRSTMERAI